MYNIVKEFIKNPFLKFYFSSQGTRKLIQHTQDVFIFFI